MERTSRVKYIFILISMAFFTVIVGAGCTHVYTAHGAYYRVRKGDTLASVASRYKVSAQDLAEVNNIENPKELNAGTSLYIPGMTPSRFAAILKQEGIQVSRVTKKEKQKQKEFSMKTQSLVQTEHGKFAWPVQGEISSSYGMRHGRKHDGIDIRAETGTPVYAAANGEVVYSKRMRGYGNLVLLKHEDDFFTVYAHNSVNLVKVGAKVKQGQLISRVGRTGRATGPHLHFEVREGAKARNPLFFLSKTTFMAKAKEDKEEDNYGGPEGGGDEF